MEELKVGGTYRHYKNKLYKLVGLAKHSETLEDYVVYEALYENETSKLWVRPRELFLGDVEVNGEKVPHFRLIS